MESKTFTPGRIAGLVLIAGTLLGLFAIWLAPGTRAVSVPAGAHAGELAMKPCTYPTERGDHRADCGTLVVRENGSGSRLIALPVTRIRARAAKPGAPVFRLEGGPGQSNMTFPYANRIADRHDVVLVGYRGVDGSSKLDCPEVSSALRRSADVLGAASLRAYTNAFRSCADRLRSDGVDLAGYSLSQRVDDLEAARVALGYDRVNLLSESAGTRTAMIYAWRHPASIERSVMIGVNPPGHFLWDPAATDRLVSRYSRLCAADASCQTGDLEGAMRRTAADLPGHWGPLPIKRGNVRLASFMGLVDSTSAASPMSSPMTIDSWLSASRGDAAGLWFQSLAGDLMLPKAWVWGDVAAVSRADAAAAERHFASERGSLLGDPGNEFLWGGGSLVNAWPANHADDQYARMRTSNVPTLLVGGTLDLATPAGAATRELLPHLPNGRQVVLSELGHTTDFWTQQRRASTRLVGTYFDTGRVDDSLYRHRAMDFHAPLRQTLLAKALVGGLAGFAAVTLLSLLGLWRASRRRDRVAGRAAATARSVLALVLGLGGWALGVLLALSLSLRAPVDGALVVVPSVAVPVGLGVYWAWSRRSLPKRTRRAGLAVALAGAGLGAWLGFSAAVEPIALFTAILGAVALANLGLITLDVRRERPAGASVFARKVRRVTA